MRGGRFGAQEAQSALLRLMRGQGFCAARPAVTVAGKAFCFTGRSARASRETLAQTAAALGGVFHPRVTRSTDYLVVCSEGSPTWKCGSYGGKIRRAAHIRGGGGRVAIIGEDMFWAACEREGKTKPESGMI